MTTRSRSTDTPDLIQIARKKLMALGIQTEAVDEGRLVTGTISAGGAPIVNPLSREDVGEIQFYVEGHDKLHITHPASVAGVPPIEFYSASDLETLRITIASHLDQQARVVRRLNDRLRKLGFEIETRDRLACVQAIFDVEMVGTVLVEASHEGVQLLQCTPIGRGQPISLARLSMDLEQFDDPSDVEIHLSSIVEKAPRERPPSPASPRPAPGHRPLVATQAAAASAVSLGWLLDTIGPEFFARKTLPLSLNLIVDDRPARLELDLQNRKTMGARVFVEEELRWQGHIAASQLGTLESFVAGALQKAANEGTSVPQPAGGDTHGLIPPVVGEVWLMGVELLDEGPQDVRYVALNARGGSQGAPRVLPRATFEKVFSAHGASYRMFVKIVGVTPTHVTYQRLSGDRRLVAAPRKLPLAVFLDAFIAEAAA